MLYDMLRATVDVCGGKTALRQKDLTLTYSDLWKQSDALAVSLQQRGVKAGDRVVIIAVNSTESVVAQWAIYKCHAICVYMNEQLKSGELAQILGDCNPSLVLYRPSGKESDKPPVTTHPTAGIGMLIREGLDLGMTWSVQPDAADDSLIANIIYTSGSTGVPKGVCLTHKNLVSVAKMAADGYRTIAEDRYLMVVPLHYIHGLMILVAMQSRGAEIEFMNSFMFPAAVTKKLQESGASGFSGVPYHFSALVERGGFLTADLPALRWIGVTGGTITPERLRQIREAKPDIEIHISYGQTECSPRITLLSPDKIDSKPESVGAAPEGLTVEFLSDNGKPVSQGEMGELVVCGPTVMHGYWNDPVATARVVDQHGRLHTGDLAYIDAEGDIFIKGRIQAMIKSAGERIFPEELEALFNRHPDVANVAITGVPDPLYGQRVEAHIVLDSALSTDKSSAERLKQIQDFCQSNVPFARAPRHYHLWEEFPLKANGKTDKQRLMSDVAGRSE
ncbi:MAG: class I adenylate-forming enzyme family protein [Granulosicoccus sp.]